VLWGDHGWHLGENTSWGKHAPLNKALRSAFIMRVPGQEMPGLATTSLAATVDIYPTLMDFCGLENRKTTKPLDGLSLRPVLENPGAQIRDAAVSFWKNSTSMVSGNYRLIVAGEGDGDYAYELYDHRTDPGELKNIAAQYPERVKDLMQVLEQEYPAIVIKGK
jgi:arylsulfatase A-like enzyme